MTRWGDIALWLGVVGRDAAGGIYELLRSAFQRAVEHEAVREPDAREHHRDGDEVRAVSIGECDGLEGRHQALRIWHQRTAHTETDEMTHEPTAAPRRVKNDDERFARVKRIGKFEPGADRDEDRG